MNYFIDLFTPETAKAFTKSNQEISGFRIYYRKTYVENKNIGMAINLYVIAHAYKDLLACLK